MLGKHGKWKLAAICLMLAALALLFQLGKPGAGKDPSANRRTTAAENHPGNREAPHSDETEPTRRKMEREKVARPSGRSKAALLKETRRVFGRAEAARAKKQSEYFNEVEATYIYTVEPPTPEEIASVRSRMEDLLEEVAPGDREEFYKMLKDEIQSYDPYGVEGRKVMMIMVPIAGPMRMRGLVIEPPGDPEEFRKIIISGNIYSLQIRYGYFADEDRTTLERFDQLMVWDPEKPE